MEKTQQTNGQAKDTGPGFGIYVHWPFCESKCPYCDFNSHTADSVNQSAWLDAYIHELEWAANDLHTESDKRPAITSIFFGGGTPSLMMPEIVDGILSAIKDRFTLSDDLEVTLEANPSSAEVERFHGYHDAGVNRLSIGVQALDDEALRFLGRRHDHASALRAIEAAAAIFPRYSFDMIYARPNQSADDWRGELRNALSLCGEHLSVYQLTIESGTVFARQGVPPASEIVAEELFEMTQDILGEAGMPAYEISNHAQTDAECRHNLTYWLAGGYLGVGPGAHGRLPGRTENPDGWRAQYRIHNPTRWLESVNASGHGTAKVTPLDQGDRRDEAIMMGLRLPGGISQDNFRRACGLDLHQAFNAHNVERLINGGFITLDEQGLRATPDGWRRLNAVLATLLSD